MESLIAHVASSRQPRHCSCSRPPPAPRPTPSRRARARSRPSRRGRSRPTRSARRRSKCDFRTIQKAVNAAKAGDKITRAPRHLPRGGHDQRAQEALPAHRRQPQQARARVVLDGRSKQAERLLHQRRRPGHDQRLHGPRLQGQRLLRRQRRRLQADQPHRRPHRRLRRLRLQLQGRRDVALGGLTTTATRASTSARRRSSPTPIRSIVTRRRELGQPDRVLGHEHALRDDHAAEVLQQRHRDRPERAGVGEVPARRGRTSSPTTTSSGTTSTSTRARRSSPRSRASSPLVPIGTGVLLLGGRGNRIEDNRIYGNYLVGVAAVEGILLDKTPEARALAGNQITGNAVRRRRRRPQRPRPRLRRQRHRQLLGSEHRRADDAARPTRAMFPACPFDGANTFSKPAQDAARSATPAPPPSTPGSSTRTRPAPA